MGIVRSFLRKLRKSSCMACQQPFCSSCVTLTDRAALCSRTTCIGGSAALCGMITVSIHGSMKLALFP